MGVDFTLMFNINDFLQKVSKVKASDVHLTVGKRPSLRVSGQVIKLDEPPRQIFTIKNTALAAVCSLKILFRVYFLFLLYNHIAIYIIISQF